MVAVIAAGLVALALVEGSTAATLRTWTQIGADIDGAEGDLLGFSVARSADGSRIAIGAHFNNGNGGGDWLSAADGGVFSFGNATFRGSIPFLVPPRTHSRAMAQWAHCRNHDLEQRLPHDGRRRRNIRLLRHSLPRVTRQQPTPATRHRHHTSPVRNLTPPYRERELETAVVSRRRMGRQGAPKSMIDRPSPMGWAATGTPFHEFARTCPVAMSTGSRNAYCPAMGLLNIGV